MGLALDFDNHGDEVDSRISNWCDQIRANFSQSLIQLRKNYKEKNMPLFDSFCVDHTIMNAPGVRLSKVMKTTKGDDISVFDLRFCKPNVDILPSAGFTR